MDFNEYLKQRGQRYSQELVKTLVQYKKDNLHPPYVWKFKKASIATCSESDIQNIYNLHYQYQGLLNKKQSLLEDLLQKGQLDDNTKKRINNARNEEILDDIALKFKLAEADEAGKPLNQKLAEALSCDHDLRNLIRETLQHHATIVCQRGTEAKDDSKFSVYFSHKEKVSELLGSENSHRYLALKRGKKTKEITFSFQIKTDHLLKAFCDKATQLCDTNSDLKGADNTKASKIALEQLALPSLERELHRKLSQKAEDTAINIFCKNLEKILLSDVFPDKVVMGIKCTTHRHPITLSIIDKNGDFLESAEANFFDNDQKEIATAIFLAFVEKYKIEAVALGSGTPNPITIKRVENFVRDTLKDVKVMLPIVRVSDRASMTYSRGEIGESEFPELTETAREAVHFARKLQDPLYELAKVKLGYLGVGQYQSEVNPKKLDHHLNQIYYSAIHKIGVDINRASSALLAKVSGINKDIAQKIFQLKKEKGSILNKQVLRKITDWKDSDFEQAYPFLRIVSGLSPFDRTFATYDDVAIIENWAKKKHIDLKDYTKEKLEVLLNSETIDINAENKKILLDELKLEYSDQRKELDPILFNQSIRSMKDLRAGANYPGLVSNVTNFGVFVDVGIGHDGLVPLSELSHTHFKEASDLFQPGDKVLVRVIKVDLDAKRITYTVKNAGLEKQKAPKEQKPRHPHKRENSFRDKGTRNNAKPNQNKSRGSRGPLTDNPFAALAELTSSQKNNND